MLIIGDLAVQERWTEYAIRFPDGRLLECATFEEAEDLTRNWTDILIVKRFVYVTEYTFDM